MKTINYKGKGEHSVNDLELIIEQQAEELHLIKSGQKPLIIDSVVRSAIMKRYLAFYGDDYYPDGGMNDFINDFDTLKECEKAIEQKHKENRPDDDKWAWAWKQIWDSDKREFVVNTFD